MMTVVEYIKQLQALPQDAYCLTHDNDPESTIPFIYDADGAEEASEYETRRFNPGKYVILN